MPYRDYSTGSQAALRVFGYADLSPADGRDVGTLRGQPKRLALLIYLTVSQQGEFVERDDLLALFWPDTDGAHARASLRQSLACLRRTLGPGLVLTRGNRGVGVDRGRLWCDAHEFEGRLSQERHEDALLLYRGPFAEGLHVPAGREFEEWIQGRREHYRGRAVEAAWRVAGSREARGQAAEAAFWGKRALALSGPEELQVQRLLGLLGRVGDGAGAARVYRGLAEYLRNEWGVTPSEETTRLYEAVRSATGGASAVGPYPETGRRTGDRRRAPDRRVRAGPPPPLAEERRSGADRRARGERRFGQDRRAPL